jgi:hypothetical protein
MKKILDCEDDYISRTDSKLGLIFPNACCGHFLYTFYSSEPAQSLGTYRSDKFGTAHCQNRNTFDVYGEFNNEFQHRDKLIIDQSTKPDFLAHYYDYDLTRKLYPNHFLIGIQISRELLLLHVYMMVYKVIGSDRPDTVKLWLTRPFPEQVLRFQSFFDHYNNYIYSDSVDLIYTTKEILYDKTINPRLIEYRKFQQQYVDNYIDFFEKYKLYFSKELREQYDFEKEFIDKYREKLYI